MATSAKSVAAVRETRKGATIHKTNERPGTRAQVRYVRVSAYKAREVLDLIRGKHVADADEILQFVERDIAIIIRKALASAVANATNNDAQDPETLYVSACYADEGPTLKRWRPRARGRATRIRKRTCHITIIVGRYSVEEFDRIRARQAESGRATPDAASARARRVAGSKRRSGAAAEEAPAEDSTAEDSTVEESTVDEAATDEATAEQAGDEAATDEVVSDAEAEAADDAAGADADADAADDSDGETEKKDED